MPGGTPRPLHPALGYSARLAGRRPGGWFRESATHRLGEQAERATREAWEKGTPTRPDGKAREFDFGRRVGTGPNGGGQTRVKTHMDDNGMIHGHPSGPESP